MAKLKSPSKLAKKGSTLGQRAADGVRSGMGSWPFVFCFLGAMLFWAYLNSIALKRHPFDPYPYILLNLMLSTLAGLQGAILLIAAKRADQIMDIIIQHILHNTTQTLRVEKKLVLLIQENTELTETVHELTRVIHDHITKDIKEAKKK